MIFKEALLEVESGGDGLGSFDVSLTSVDHGNVAKTERNDAPSEDVNNIGARIPAGEHVQRNGRVRSVREPSNQQRRVAYIKSTLVKTPMVLEPSGSTSRASFKPSELAKSWLAAVTARMIELGLVMNLRSMSLIWRSMSFGYTKGHVL